MTQTATTRWFVALAALLVLPLVGAQAQPLDDDFIFFVDGANVLIPETDFSIDDDPLDPDAPGKVARFDYGVFTPVRAAGWERTEGTDASAYIGEEYGDSDYKLFVRILSGPENAGKNVSLTFFDSTNDPAVSREELEGGAEGDLEFRAVWAMPDEAHSGEWVSYAIPLPPATVAALDSAKVGKKSDGSPLGVEFDPLAANWDYTGGWNNGGGYGFGPTGGFNPGPTDPLWQEFSWDQMHALAVFFDHPDGGESIYLDDIYIAQEELDLSVATGAPAPMDNISVSAEGEANVISFQPNPDFGGYNVYFSDSEITDPSAPGVIRLANFAFDAEAFEVAHRYEIPHPSLGEAPLFYAVTSLSQFGVENPDVSASAGSVTNGGLRQQPFIIGLTDDEANTIFGNLANGEVSDEGFPDGYPTFFIDNSHSQLGDSPTPELPEDSDISGRLRMAYSSFNELYIYAEFTDDAIQFTGPGDNPGTETWNYDSFEVGWGNYDVRDVEGGSLLTGSPHQDMERGDFADYQFRISGLQDAAGTVIGSTTFIGWSLEGEVQGGGSVVEQTDTGWRSLTIVPLNAIQNQDEGDIVLDPPGPDEIRFFPMELSINDADGSLREHQITWGLKPNHTSQWWNTPAQWPTVAMAGRNTAMPTAGEDDAAQVDRFELAANFPNPFTRTTEIQYALSEASEVTLEVFDVLGRRVAVLVDETRSAGQHDVEFDASGLASGLYIYRIQAGDRTAMRQMMVVR